MPSSGAGSSTDAMHEVPDIPPPLRRKPQARGNIGAGKLYADQAAFDADIEKFNQEQAERRGIMKQRERALDRQRDRSTRQRDREEETDNERRVRQRREDAEQAAAHADREHERQAGRRRLSRLEQQQAWAADVASFAGVFASAEPREHPLAYYGHRPRDWLLEGKQIVALHKFIVAHPPTGESDWEGMIDDRAFVLWRKAGAKPRGKSWADCWDYITHPGDGYWMLLALPSAPKMLATPEPPPALRGCRPMVTENERRAKRGLGPLPGWEPMVQDGYMAPPVFFSEDEIRRRRAKVALEEAFRAGKVGMFDHHNNRSSKFWKDVNAAAVCNCNWQLCRCPIGLVLNAELEPVRPLRAARIEDC